MIFGDTANDSKQSLLPHMLNVVRVFLKTLLGKLENIPGACHQGHAQSVPTNGEARNIWVRGQD